MFRRTYFALKWIQTVWRRWRRRRLKFHVRRIKPKNHGVAYFLEGVIAPESTIGSTCLMTSHTLSPDSIAFIAGAIFCLFFQYFSISFQYSAFFCQLLFFPPIFCLFCHSSAFFAILLPFSPFFCLFFPIFCLFWVIFSLFLPIFCIFFPIFCLFSQSSAFFPIFCLFPNLLPFFQSSAFLCQSSAFFPIFSLFCQSSAFFANFQPFFANLLHLFPIFCLSLPIFCFSLWLMAADNTPGDRDGARSELLFCFVTIFPETTRLPHSLPTSRRRRSTLFQECRRSNRSDNVTAF